VLLLSVIAHCAAEEEPVKDRKLEDKSKKPRLSTKHGGRAAHSTSTVLIYVIFSYAFGFI